MRFWFRVIFFFFISTVIFEKTYPILKIKSRKITIFNVIYCVYCNRSPTKTTFGLPSMHCKNYDTIVLRK
jgi:hypothetical protein